MRGGRRMHLTNDTYVIVLRTRSFTERYYRDKKGWVKVSARGRRFRMTAEQLLNHLLPAVAGVKPGLAVSVRHREPGGGGRRPVRKGPTSGRSASATPGARPRRAAGVRARPPRRSGRS